MDELMSGKWRVTAVNGQPVMADFTPEFEFNAEGQITGRASINRFFGPFTYKENVLSFGALGSTMMAGPPEAMEQEREFLKVLDGERPVVFKEGILTIGTTELGTVEAVLEAPEVGLPGAADRRAGSGGVFDESGSPALEPEEDPEGDGADDDDDYRNADDYDDEDDRDRGDNDEDDR